MRRRFKKLVPALVDQLTELKRFIKKQIWDRGKENTKFSFGHKRSKIFGNIHTEKKCEKIL